MSSKIAEHDDGIAITRVVAMLSILMCHIIKYYSFVPGAAFLGQFFNIGVEMFLIISGYLYGMRFITDYKVWISNRWLKICLPVLVWYIILFFFGAERNFSTFLIYVFNIQGLSWISDYVGFYQPAIGLEHTWFITIIMICYLLIPMLQKVRVKCSSKETIRILIFVWMIAIVAPFVHIQGFFYIVFGAVPRSFPVF